MPFDFLMRRARGKPEPDNAAPTLLPEEIEAEEHELYCPKCGMRMLRG